MTPEAWRAKAELQAHGMEVDMGTRQWECGARWSEWEGRTRGMEE